MAEDPGFQRGADTGAAVKIEQGELRLARTSRAAVAGMPHLNPDIAR
jgi:hypothetical protein